MQHGSTGRRSTRRRSRRPDSTRHAPARGGDASVGLHTGLECFGITAAIGVVLGDVAPVRPAALFCARTRTHPEHRPRVHDATPISDTPRSDTPLSAAPTGMSLMSSITTSTTYPGRWGATTS